MHPPAAHQPVPLSMVVRSQSPPFQAQQLPHELVQFNGTITRTHVELVLALPIAVLSQGSYLVILFNVQNQDPP